MCINIYIYGFKLKLYSLNNGYIGFYNTSILSNLFAVLFLSFLSPLTVTVASEFKQKICAEDNTFLLGGHSFLKSMFPSWIEPKQYVLAHSLQT